MAYTPKLFGGAATRSGKLTSRIPQIVATLDEKTLEGVKELAERIADGARSRVPDATPIGAGLIAAIHVETEEDLGALTLGLAHTTQSVAVVAGNHDIFYGHIVENGSVHTSARPFLVPAFEAERENLNALVSDALKDL